MYTGFNQNGKAVAMSESIAEIMNGMAIGGYRFYVIANDRNEVLVNELKGRPLPKRTSHGTLTVKRLYPLCILRAKLTAIETSPEWHSNHEGVRVLKGAIEYLERINEGTL